MKMMNRADFTSEGLMRLALLLDALDVPQKVTADMLDAGAKIAPILQKLPDNADPSELTNALLSAATAIVTPHHETAGKLIGALSLVLQHWAEAYAKRVLAGSTLTGTADLT